MQALEAAETDRTLKTGASSRAPRCPSLLAAALAVLVAVAVAATVACGSQEAGLSPAQGTAASSGPEILSLAPSKSPGGGANELVLSWKPIPGIDRFVLCETVPPYGTECQDHIGVSEATVTLPGTTDDPQASGTWLKYLWLQACTARECSSPPIAAGAIARRIAYGPNGWNFTVLVRRLEAGRVEVALGNASQGPPKTSTLIARAPGGSELARCDALTSGEWCGPFEAALLSNDIAAEQIYGDVGLTVEFPVVPSTTAPGESPPSP